MEISPMTDQPNVRPRPKLAKPVVVAQWWRNRGGEAIRVVLSSYNEHNLVDVRTWSTGANGTLKPGKGFSCGVRHLSQLVKGFNKALGKARELGLVDPKADHE
jgi:Transcriptional Coactivator p15 (PC4)